VTDIARRLRTLEAHHSGTGQITGIRFDWTGDCGEARAAVLIPLTGVILSLVEFRARYPSGNCDQLFWGVDPHKM
jgi:hypothetical protein